MWAASIDIAVPPEAQSTDANMFADSLSRSISSSQPETLVKSIQLSVTYQRTVALEDPAVSVAPSTLSAAVEAQDCAPPPPPGGSCEASASWRGSTTSNGASGRRRRMQTSGNGGSGQRQEGVITVERTVASGPLVPPPLNTSMLAASLGIANASDLTASNTGGVRVRADVVVVQSASVPPWVEDFASITSSFASDLGLPTGTLTAVAYAPPLAPPRPPAAPPAPPWYGVSSLSVPLEIGIGVGVASAAVCLMLLCYYCDASPVEKQSLKRWRRMVPRAPTESGATSSRRGRVATASGACNRCGRGEDTAEETVAGWWLWRVPPYTIRNTGTGGVAGGAMEVAPAPAPAQAQALTAEPPAVAPGGLDGSLAGEDFVQRL